MNSSFGAAEATAHAAIQAPSSAKTRASSRVSGEQRELAETHARYGHIPRYVLAALLSRSPEAVRCKLRRLRARKLLSVEDAGPFTYSALTLAGAKRFGVAPPRELGAGALFVQFAVAEFAAQTGQRVLTPEELYALLTEHLEPRVGPLANASVFRRRWYVDHEHRLSLLEVDTLGEMSAQALLARVAARLSKLCRKSSGWTGLLAKDLSVSVLSRRDRTAELALAAREAEFTLPTSVFRAPVLAHLRGEKA